MSTEHLPEPGAVRAFWVSASSVPDDGGNTSAVVDLQLRGVRPEEFQTTGVDIERPLLPIPELATVAESFTSGVSGVEQHFHLHPDDAGRLGKLLIDAAFALGQLRPGGAHAAHAPEGAEESQKVEEVGVAKRFRVAPGTVEMTSGDSVRVVMLDFAVVSGSDAHDPDAPPSTDTVLMDVDAARTLGHEITAVTDSMTPTA